MNTSGAVVLGMVYDFLPFMLLPIYNSMTRIKNDWIEAVSYTHLDVYKRQAYNCLYRKYIT